MIIKLSIISFIAVCTINTFSLGGRNLIILLLTLEGLFLGIALLFLSFHLESINTLLNLDALFASIATIITAAAESAVGLALVALAYKETKSILISKP